MCSNMAPEIEHTSTRLTKKGWQGERMSLKEKQKTTQKGQNPQVRARNCRSGIYSQSTLKTSIINIILLYRSRKKQSMVKIWRTVCPIHETWRALGWSGKRGKPSTPRNGELTNVTFAQRRTEVEGNDEGNHQEVLKPVWQYLTHFSIHAELTQLQECKEMCSTLDFQLDVGIVLLSHMTVDNS